MKKEIKEYKEGDKNPFMSEEEYSVNSQSYSKKIGTESKTGNSELQSIANAKCIPKGVVLPTDILNSKEQKICEKTTCRNCELNNCGCRE
jgi:hypothetical protein